MRTTIDLPDDLHDLARSLARDTGRTLSETVAMLIRRAVEPPSEDRALALDEHGWPVRAGGRPITADDVRSLEDEW